MPAARARVVVVVVAVGMAVAAWLAGDGGGARAAIGQATGPLVATAPDDSAVLVAQDLAPGDARAGEVTVTNAGDAAGPFALSAAGLVDAGAPLSGVLELAVHDVTAGRTVYAGALTGLRTVALGTLAQGEAHRYRFTVSFPGGRQASADNAYQSASTVVTFVWSTTPAATTGSPPSAPAVPDLQGSNAPVAATGIGKLPRVAIGAAYRQSGRRGRITTWVRCEATCRIALDGTASVGSRKARLRTVRRTMSVPGRVQMRVPLPRAARAAVAGGRRVTVRLRARATIGGRVVVTRRTVVVSRHR
jgi:hypothetical protein